MLTNHQLHLSPSIIYVGEGNYNLRYKAENHLSVRPSAFFGQVDLSRGCT